MRTTSLVAIVDVVQAATRLHMPSEHRAQARHAGLALEQAEVDGVVELAQVPVERVDDGAVGACVGDQEAPVSQFAGSRRQR